MKFQKRSIRRKALFALYRQNWNIGVVQAPIHEIAGLSGTAKQKRALASIHWMAEKRGCFRADPFPIVGHDGTDLRIFHEALEWRIGRGRIDHVDFSTRSGFGHPAVSLESSGHLSYPFLFEYQGRTGFLPEHSSMRDLSFYPVDENGLPTEKITVMPQTELVDSTILIKDGVLWLFSTIAGPSDNSELHIFYATTLEGPWFAHKANPVKVDVGSSRPAGPIFFHKNTIYRPSQDSKLYYGSRIVVNKIDVLNDDCFNETAVSEIKFEAGHRYNFGLHTVASAGDFTVVDGARLESKLHPLLDKSCQLLLSTVR